MTNSEILRADLLDILFENRNKGYGAYELRKSYDRRLLAAMGSGIALLAGLVAFSYFSSNNKDSSIVAPVKQEITIREVRVQTDKPKQPEKPKQVEQAKPKTTPPAPKVAQIKFTTPVIKPDEKVKETAKPVVETDDKQIGFTDTDGVKDNGSIKQPEPVVERGTSGTGNAGPAQPQQPEFVIQERGAEYPGGDEALKKFLGRYLNTPSGLEAGEKAMVKVRFKVEKDGSVSSFEIISSGGNEFDNEVLRVCKKMPKWVPAIQNGINVPVLHILPVTFIGMEE